ncbi:MAG: acyl-CoA dehydrogenase family protein [Candidatus Omnitrophota bacterium]
MSIFDTRMAKEKRESLEFAEASREDEWKYPSFASRLFQGAVEWDLISPYPEQSEEDKKEGDEFLKKLEAFLKVNLDPDDVDITREIPEKVIKGLFEMGAFAVKIPKEYGGLGMSQTNYNRAVHLLGSYCGSTAALISAHQSIGVPQPLILFGTEEQKKKFLPRFRQGAISGFALTESDVGSDPRKLRTIAAPTEDGKHFILNGEKLWCTNGNVADLILVMAETPPKVIRGKERKQITAFIVESNTPGFEVTYRCKFMGLNAIQNGLIKLNNVKVPRENIVLGEGQGLKLAFITLNTGRLTLPAAVTGMSKWCLHVARTWAKERQQWGCSIGEHEAVASKLSYIAATSFAMDAMTWIVSYMADNKKFDIRLEAAVAKLFCTDESWKIVDHAMQVRGGRGYETGPSLKGRGKPAYPIERAMRDSRVNTILEGSSEIMHLFIAREALDFHLKSMKDLFDPRVPIVKKLQVALAAGFNYALWYPKLWIPCFRGGKGVSNRVLRKHTRFVSASSKRLARAVFHKMALYQKKLVNKQNILNRFIDIGVDLFAMSCACSYAEKLLAKGEKSANSVELADLFCRIATERIQNNFRKNCRNYDKQSNTTAKKLLAGEFDWLENDIITQ